jgi:hypothetical protein
MEPSIAVLSAIYGGVCSVHCLVTKSFFGLSLTGFVFVLEFSHQQ